ncbi:hypothetical protein [Lunatibacter salilacus]|uniref:hypothetical protein n=1 Tax=Lunatibacter salilacus TaxID=2483804 RepID=UPI00131AE89A|nr:hypothetical protein [Lunatibacter salilacus]
METNRAHKNVFKERITILMVLLFCVLVSSSEYIIQSSSEEILTEQQTSSNDTSEENTTCIHTAVDAVVPFVVVVLDQVFHLISEVISPESNPTSQYNGLIAYSNQFFEVLFEHIVSTNAP